MFKRNIFTILYTLGIFCCIYPFWFKEESYSQNIVMIVITAVTGISYLFYFCKWIYSVMQIWVVTIWGDEKGIEEGVSACY